MRKRNHMFYDVHMITMIVYCYDGSNGRICIVATSAAFVSRDQQNIIEIMFVFIFAEQVCQFSALILPLYIIFFFQQCFVYNTSLVVALNRSTLAAFGF